MYIYSVISYFLSICCIKVNICFGRTTICTSGMKQNRSTEWCSKLKNPEAISVQERLISKFFNEGECWRKYTFNSFLCTRIYCYYVDVQHLTGMKGRVSNRFSLKNFYVLYMKFLYIFSGVFLTANKNFLDSAVHMGKLRLIRSVLGTPKFPC